MSSKYKKNLEGWVAHLDEATGLPTKKWTGEIRINKERKKKKEGQTDKKRKKQTLEIELDTDQGDYYVYEPGSDTPIYRYNPRVDKVTISDEEKFEEYFVGDKNKEKQLEKIRKNALSSILALAESEYDKAKRLRLGNHEPRRDDKRLKRILEKLEKKKGFKSLNNTAEPAEIAEVTSQDKGKKDKGPNTPKDGKVSANVDVELTINTASGGSGGSGGSRGGGGGSVQNSGSGNRIDTESDIVKTSIVSLEMPIETPPIAAINDGSMRYPVIPPPFGYDHIKITAYTYVKSGLSKQQAKGQATKDLKERFSKPLGNVILPMQPNLSETNSVDWGGDKINALQLAAADLAEGAIGKLGKLDILGAAQGLASGTISEIKKALADPDVKQGVAAYFAGQAVGANVLTRATGTVINPNLELLFSGPRLRTFNFNFNLTPRSDDEAIMIRRIIRFFKKTSAPSISSSGNFLQTPAVYLLEYIFDQDDGGQHPYLNKFKPCALTSFNVNYTPDGSYSTYNTGSMTSYAITMSFGELQPIYAGDYINSSEDDMGF